ncbi:hypothetical protein [uncultured Pseudodesulfovibrio sp.]|uniref:hypothetical protein n=1 Tax=uncultured Pseudodesulfovibrio sp. TaxID=2035858 RepID=UPI0029C6CFAB|nr:hypothetical protein [uncultured Pseudodesulfovibrio sp.]
MLTAPMGVTLKAPDDNSSYWSPFVAIYKQLKRKLLSDKCLYPLNISYEKVFRRIKYEYPLEVAFSFALRELELRKEIGDKKARHYPKEVNESDFDKIKGDVDIPLFNTEREDLIEIVRSQARYRFKSFREFDRNITFDEVFGEVAHVFMKCSTKFDPSAGKSNSEKATIGTYLNVAVTNHIRDLWRERAKEAELWKEYATLTRILNAGDYPMLIEGKWVAA